MSVNEAPVPFHPECEGVKKNTNHQKYILFDASVTPRIKLPGSVVELFKN